MQISIKTMLCPLFALTILVGVFLSAGIMAAYAAADPLSEQQTLSVEEVWLSGDTLHITVTDKNGGESQTIELKLSDYAKPADEYVTIQATDSNGITSNSVQFKNPYYVPQESGASEASASTTPTVSAAPNGVNPAGEGRSFTPDGTGTVLDNATDGDGKEFFTVETSDGNVFYLIVDRQRNNDNVYLLNAVTENDLVSLAKPGDGKSESAIKTPAPPVTAAPAETEPEPTPVPETKSGSTGTIVFILIAAIAAGGTGYYYKILRPKQLEMEDSDEYEPEEFDENEEMDVTDDEKEDEV